MNRYSNQCTKLGLAPSWSNVYNKVNVQLQNHEFGEISTRELELAKYLDTVERVHVVDAE